MQHALNPVAERQRDSRPAPSHTSRKDLLILATNRFCDADTYDRLSMEQYKEAFYLLIEAADFPTKQIVARTLANCMATPRPIVLYFALEPIEIARPILTSSMVLGQLDMMRVMDMKGETYAQLIATRPDIGPSVVRKLREMDHEDINAALNNNRALADNRPQYGAEDLFRQILSRHAAPENQPEISTADCSKAAVGLHDQPEEEVIQGKPAETIEASEAPAATGAEQKLLAAAARGGRLIEPAKAVPLPAVQSFDFGEAMEKTARSRSHQAMAALMQKRFGLSFETSHQVLADKSGDTLAVLLRAAEVAPAQANRIQLLTHPTIGLSVHNAMRAVRFYERMNTESCLAAVNQWPRQSNETANHVPYLAESKPARHPEGGVQQAQTGSISGQNFRKAG